MDGATLPTRRTTIAAGADAPTIFGERWNVMALLGTGGMGTVYLARDNELGELVALKMVRPALAVDAELVERFRDEVRLSRRVSSPFVARTHDLGVHDGRLFLTMQYVEGESLSTRLRRQGALPLGDVVRIAHDLCAGLDAIHAVGVVHRDLKPANVLLATDGRAVITDFGIALRADDARRGDASGTPTYAAPEQLLGGHVDARSDVFSLGALLFAAATGQKPFVGPRTGDEPPPNARRTRASVPDAFSRALSTAMATDPRRRFDSARALYDALALLAGSRVDQPLLELVRSTARTGRVVAIDVTSDGVPSSFREIVCSHLAARLNDSGKARVGPRADAEAAIEGVLGVQGTGCVLRLTLRSPDGDVFWRGSFEGPFTDLPRMIEAAVNALSKALAAGTPAPQERPSFRTREAAELFLRARATYRDYNFGNAEEAVALFERIGELEPRNPTVIAWTAVAMSRVRFFQDGAADRTRPLVEQARALGAEDAVLHTALAQTELHDMRASEAAGNFVKALRAAPGALDVRAAFALFLGEIGAREPALELAASVYARDPTYVSVLELPMRAAASAGRFDEALAICEGIDKDSPAATRLLVPALRYCLWNRDSETFRRLAPRTETMDGVTRMLVSALGDALLKRSTSRAHDDMIAMLGPRRRALVLQFACEMGALLEDDAFYFRALDACVAAGLFDIWWLDACPLFERHRGTVHYERARMTVQSRAFDALVVMDDCLTSS